MQLFVLLTAHSTCNCGQAAKDAYEKALALIDKPYARKQIATADQKINDIKKTQLAINQQKEKDSIQNAQYNSLIKKADSYFDAQQYNAARDEYKMALSIKHDQYAENRLILTDNALSDLSAKAKAAKDSIAKKNEAINKYNILIAKAKVAYINNDYITAQQVYMQASELRSDEEEPKRMLADINNKLISLVQAKEIQDKYDSITAKADLCLANNDYKVALENYQQALLLKPEEAYYLQKQINFLNRQLTVKDSTEIEDKKAADRRQKFTDGMDAYNKGRIALRELRYEDALLEFEKFLILIPDTSDLNTNQYNQQGFINFANAKVKDLKDYLLKQKIKDSASKAEKLIQKPTAVDSINHKTSSLILYIPAQNEIRKIGIKKNELNHSCAESNQKASRQFLTFKPVYYVDNISLKLI
jgi:tetratricopeptide (TPR) repeat protein